MNFDTPILFLIFNRTETTKQVFEKIRAIKPKYLYVAADGPRDQQEVIKCDNTRAIIKNIDWDCEVKTLFRDKNLGCGKAVSEGITWFFEHVECGIILEDDCLPEITFFHFAEILLKKYNNDLKVWHISGNNFQDNNQRGEASYYFSMFTHIWGWATWRNRWKEYKLNIDNYDIKSDVKIYTEDNRMFKYFERRKNQVSSNKINTWDYQWLFCMWQHGGYSIIPNKNLVTNIGFGDDATNTKSTSRLANMPMYSMDNLIFENNVTLHTEADIYTFEHTFYKPLNFIRKFLIRIG
jgi:hypothetical protein